MILEKEKFMDRLITFNWFQQNYVRYTFIQKEKLVEHSGVTSEYFISLREEFDKLAVLEEKVLSELSTNAKELPKKDLDIILSYMQSYLDKVYDRFFDDHAKDLENFFYPDMHPSISSIQNAIRRVINTKNENPKPLPVNNPMSLIKLEYHNVFKEYESSLSEKIILWKDNKDKTNCAAFCLFLFDKDYFSPNELKTTKLFASSKYGNDFDVVVDKLQKKDNRADRDKRITAIKRLVLKKPYGTI